MKFPYIKRLIDEELDFALKSKGGILVTGPKFCGKSRTCEQHSKTHIYMQNEENKDNLISLAELSPHKFLNSGAKPILIDEWQVIPFIWNSIRYEIDQNNEFGQYLLTGSSTPIKLENQHTGIGRIIKMTMRTMSLFESKDSTGEVSLEKLFSNPTIKTKLINKTLDDYAYYLCRGGWPLAVVCNNRKIALQQAKDFYKGLVSNDLYSNENTKIYKDEKKANLFLKSYSRAIGSQTAIEEIKKDVTSNGSNIDENTINRYIKCLNELYIIEELESINFNFRSKTAIRSKNKRYFIDPSIATSALKLTPDILFKDIKSFGFLFENMVIRDLRIYVETIGGNIYHYRDANNNEIDAIVLLDDGRWGAIEIKLGSQDFIDKAAKNLIRITKNISISNNKPSFLAVITADKLLTKRDDDVFVIPLGSLKN